MAEQPNGQPYSQQPGVAVGSGGDAGVVYHELSPKVVTAIRGTGITTCAMVIMAFIFCMIQGTSHGAIYLLAMNLIISAFVGLVNGWWYRNGDLDAEKYWFILMICLVIVFQCISTDIFVFHYPTQLPPAVTTLAPNTTTTATTTLPPG